MKEKLELTKENKKIDFDKALNLLINIYEKEVEATRSEIITMLGWFIGGGLTFVISYFGWNIESIRRLVTLFIMGNLLLKFILFCVIFTMFFFLFKGTIWIMNRKFIRENILVFFGVNEHQKIRSKLYKLYFAKLEPHLWKIILDIDREKGLFNSPPEISLKNNK